ncbi:MAG: ATP-binding protein [Bacilli bacterium]|nr:ATP-binding protein [Bacilli bacterium]
MFKRKVYNEILEWKNSINHKPLIIRGLRQIGKTTLAQEFGKNNYKSVILLDFRKEKTLHEIFEGDFDVDQIMFAITLRKKDVTIIPNDTLLIFDEIQDCPNARSSLKYFAKDGRYDIIATGSLLGIKNYKISKKPTRGIPVGFEEYLEMKPMDFEEFLWANNINSEVVDNVKKSINDLKQVQPFIHNEMLSLFNKYLCIGGMPEVVAKYIETNDFNQVRRVQKRILNDYEADFGTHLNDDNEIVVDNFAKAKILETFHSIPRQLAKKNQKFQYSCIAKNAKGREYKTSIEWLEDYGLISLCHNLSALELPLDSFAIGDTFKVYVNDTGLYIAMLDDDIPAEIINGNMGSGKGAIYENVIADALNKMNLKLYYFHKDSGLEIDFIHKYASKVSLIEVKAKSGRTKSAAYILDNYEKYGVDHLIKFTSNNIGFHKNTYTFPYYSVSFLFK